ncbi:hypothetical protein LCGC14_1126010 [marine sediment metagenome]|uniref:Uncharacterized protein n=1 Tax=marine sediment metagenome TaxID=412755 RepID=A0A0F9M7A7_9ZZZZ|nr:hypothetical protein [Methylophaga sp.]
MTLYLFERIDKVTDSWHSAGGIVIIAKDRRQAKEIATKYFDSKFDKRDKVGITIDEWKSVKVFVLAGKHKPEVFIFPDEGCC